MEGKLRSTTSGIEKLGRRDHLLPLPPSAWAAAFMRLFSQVHIVLSASTCFSELIWKHLSIPGSPLGL